MRARFGLGLALFLVFQGLFLLTASGRVNRIADEFEVYLQVESLWERGSLAIPQVPPQLFFGKVGRDGQPYAPYGPGVAFLALPHHALARGTAWALGIEPTQVAAHKEWLAALTSLASSTWAALAVLALFRAALALGASQRRAALVAALLGGATLLWPYGTLFFAEPAAAMAFAWAIAWSLEGRHRLAACALAVMCATKGTYLLWTPVKAALALGDEGARSLVQAFRGEAPRGETAQVLLRRLAPYVFGGACALAVHLGNNYYRFGELLHFGYDWAEQLRPGEAPKPWSWRDLPRGLFGLLASPGKSLFLFAPPLALALARLGVARRERPALFLACVLAALILLPFYGSYMYWEGGYCFGPRHFVPLLPLLLLPLALGPAPRRSALAAVWVVGVGVQLLGVSVSYLEDQARGIRENRSRYYDLRDDVEVGRPRNVYRLGYTPLRSYPPLILDHLRGAPGSGRHGLEFLPLHLLRVNTLYRAGIPASGVWGVPGLGLLLLALGGWGVRRGLREGETGDLETGDPETGDPETGDPQAL